jgi:hypothetical protein
MVVRTIAAALAVWLVNFPLDLWAQPAPPADPPPKCYSVAEIGAALAAETGQALAYEAVTKTGTRLAVFVDSRGLWTVVVTSRKTGCAVIFDWGAHWSVPGDET